MSWFARGLAEPARPVAAPAPAPAQPELPPLVCVMHYPVALYYHTDLACIDHNGLPAAPYREEMVRHLIWHSEVFTRDDIMEPAVQNGSPRIVVGAQVRRYFPTNSVRLETWEQRVMVMCPTALNGHLVGFAPTLMDAMRYVAKGDTAALVMPW